MNKPNLQFKNNPFTIASNRIKYLGINYLQRSTKFIICKVQNAVERY